MVSLTKFIAASSFAVTVLASSAEFVLNSLCHTGTFPLETYTALQYNKNGIVGVFSDDCNSCYNFTGKITDEGYYEITESSEGELKNSKYLTINENNGLVTINDTASTESFLISTHIVYFNSSKDYTLVEEDFNSTYYLYYLDNFNGTSNKNYSTNLNSAFPNGTRYLSYEPEEASTTQSISRIAHIPQSTGGSSSSATSQSSSQSSSSSTAGASKREHLGIVGLFSFVMGWIYVYMA